MTTTPSPPNPPRAHDDPPDLVAVRTRMREIWARLEALLDARRKLEDT